MLIPLCILSGPLCGGSRQIGQQHPTKGIDSHGRMWLLDPNGRSLQGGPPLLAAIAGAWMVTDGSVFQLQDHSLFPNERRTLFAPPQTAAIIGRSSPISTSRCTI